MKSFILASLLPLASLSLLGCGDNTPPIVRFWHPAEKVFPTTDGLRDDVGPYQDPKWEDITPALECEPIPGDRPFPRWICVPRSQFTATLDRPLLGNKIPNYMVVPGLVLHQFTWPEGRTPHTTRWIPDGNAMRPLVWFAR